jgi:hypothetical protein
MPGRPGGDPQRLLQIADVWDTLELALLAAERQLSGEIGPNACPTSDQVADYLDGLHSGYDGVGHVVVCVVNDGAGHVTVAITGYALSMVPPGFGPFNWRGWGLPISETASVNVGTYSP